MTATAPRAVLAYGTLRPGEANHDWTLRGLHPMTLTVQVPGFALWGARSAFPYVWPEPGAVTVADLLEFHADEWPEALRRMDSLEGYPNLYDRQVVNAYYPSRDTGSRLTGWLYVPTRDPRGNHLRVLGGDWKANQATRAAIDAQEGTHR